MIMSSASWKLSAILLILINLSFSPRGQDQNPFECLRNGNYTNNSTYAANLNTLLSSLPSNGTGAGFFNASAGEGQDRVNALALCRGDQTPDQCRTCVRSASAALPQQCPNQKQAIIWYEFCMLRYSNEPIYATQSSDPGVIMRNTGQVSSPDEFRAARTGLFNEAEAAAGGGGPELKVGFGSADVSGSSRVYVMLQCTPDLSEGECENCLQRGVRNSESCCDSAAGVRMLMPSCFIRYESYSFYNATRLAELGVPPSSLPSPPLPSPPGNYILLIKKTELIFELHFVIIKLIFYSRNYLYIDVWFEIRPVTLYCNGFCRNRYK